MEDPKKTEPTEEPKEEPKTDLEKLKEANAEFEKELIKGREMKAEAQKLEAEKMLGGETGGHVEPEVKEDTSKEYADKVMNGEIEAT
jgi:hypothetical protein